MRRIENRFEFVVFKEIPVLIRVRPKFQRHQSLSSQIARSNQEEYFCCIGSPSVGVEKTLAKI